jgi:hypothetical protein
VRQCPRDDLEDETWQRDKDPDDFQMGDIAPAAGSMQEVWS